MLKFTNSWRFEPPGEIPDAVLPDFFQLIVKLSNQGDRKQILEHFKSCFAAAAGSASTSSSSIGWAETDLERLMQEAAVNAPLFIEAFYDGCEALKRRDQNFVTPDSDYINRILSRHNAGYELQPPNLVATTAQASIAVATQAPSLDNEAQELIQRSLAESEQLLLDGKYRPAVQEILWLLETVSTAFQGLETASGTVQGKYFNKIVDDLRRQQKGKTLDQVLSWVTALHGYLSSPTGGGVRHGADLKSGIVIGPTEARLYCNLIRSYINFLIAEHSRLAKI